MLRFFLIWASIPSIKATCLSEILNGNFKDRMTIAVDLDDVSVFRFPKIAMNTEYLDVLESDRNDYQVLARQMTNNYVLSYRTSERLSETLERLKDLPTTWNSRAKFLVHSPSVVNRTEIISIMQILWEFNVYNFLVAVRNQTVTEVYGYDFLKSECGRNLSPIIIGKCPGMSLRSLFPPHTMENNCNKTLKILWTPTEPFTIHYNLKKNPGMLISLIQVIAEKSNLSLHFGDNPDRYARDFSDGLNMQDDLKKKVGDVGVGLVGYEYEKCVIDCDCTGSTAMEYVYWVLPKAPLKPFWKSIFTPFTVQTWTYLGITLIFAVMTFWVAGIFGLDGSRCFGLFNPTMLVIQIVLGNSATCLFKNKSFKMFFLIFSLSCIIVNTDYKGKLFVLLSHPGYEEGLKTLDDILASDVPIKFYPGFSVIFMFTGKKNQMIFDRYISVNISNLQTLNHWVLKRDYITITNWGVMLFFPQYTKMFNKLELFSFHNPLVFTRDNILFDRFEIMIIRVLETGLYNKWVSDIQTSYFKRTVDDEDPEIFKLTIQHLQGAFILLTMGHLLALVFFILEHVTTRIKNL